MSFLSRHVVPTSKKQDSIIENEGKNEDWVGKYHYLPHVIIMIMTLITNTYRLLTMYQVLCYVDM